MIERFVIPLAAIVGLTIIEVCALSHGINGVLMSASIAAIGGVAGWSVRGPGARQIRREDHHDAR